MGNVDVFNIHFSSGEQVSQALLGKAAIFEEIVHRLNRNFAALYDSGLQGRFLSALVMRSAALLSQWSKVINE